MFLLRGDWEDPVLFHSHGASPCWEAPCSWYKQSVGERLACASSAHSVKWQSSKNRTTANTGKDVGKEGHCWWKIPMVQPLWRSMWRVLTKLKIEPPYNPTITLFGIYPKVSISSSRDTVHPCPQLGTRLGLESESVIHMHSGIFFKRKESKIYKRMSRAGKALLTEVISAQQDKHSTSSLVRGA